MKLAVLRRRYFSYRLPLYLAYFGCSTAALCRMIRRDKVDIVHSNTTAVIPGAVAAKLTRTPHVWHSHEMVERPRIVRKMTARLAPALSDVVLAVSGAVREHMLVDNPSAAGRIRVLHNGIDAARFGSAAGRERIRAEFGFGKGDVVVGSIGRLSRGKGQSYLMNAASIAREQGPNLRYLLVGDAFVGQECVVDELRASIDSMGLTGSVVFAGYRSDAPDVLAAMDICAVPSVLPDSFPTVVLEAMASSKPVVATSRGGAKEMVVDGETGFVVPHDDPHVLAARLCDLASFPEMRKSMGAAGRERVLECFTRERMVREFWRIMAETAQG